MSYQGLGHYEPPKKDNGLLVAIVLAVVALVGVTATLLFVEIKDTTPGTALAVASPSGTTKPKDPLQPGSTARRRLRAGRSSRSTTAGR